MIDAPLALAFTAGLVATVNPCGFAMLPAYLAWFVGVEGADALPSPAARLGRALGVSGLVSLTFISVFGIVGVLVTAGALLVIDIVPWLAIVVGIGLAAAGIAMLRGWKPVVALPQRPGGVRSRGSRSVVLFGLSYAVASLSCTLPVFLAVVAGTITSADLASGVATFVAYGTGMSLVLVAVTIAVAMTRGTFVQRMRRASRHVDRAAAVLLVVAGIYIAFYWAFTLAAPVGAGDDGLARFTEVPVELLERLSTWSVNHLEQWALPISVVLGAIVFVAIWVAMGRGSADDHAGGVGRQSRSTTSTS
jgi:cytochrome c-type biogenesis protein